MKIRNIAFIGLGLHARHYHYKILCELKKELDIHIKLLIDLKDQEDDIHEYLSSLTLKPEKMLFLDSNNRTAEYICDEAKAVLDDLVNNDEIDGVFISTEPKSHKAYALWAINHDIDVLVPDLLKLVSRKQSIYHTFYYIRNLWFNQNILSIECHHCGS